MTGAFRVAVNDQVFVVRSQRIRQHVDGLFHVRVVVDLDRLCRFIARVVADKDRNVAIRICDRFGRVERAAERRGSGRLFQILDFAVQRKDRNVRKALVVARADRDRIAGTRCFGDLRFDVVDRQIEAHECAFAEHVARQDIPEHAAGQQTGAFVRQIFAFEHRIVLGDRIEADTDAVAVAEAAEFIQRSVDRVELRGRVLPGLIVHVIPCAVDLNAREG